MMLIRAVDPHPSFRWNAQRQRYVITSGAGKGQFLSPVAVKALVEDAIALHQKYANDITEKMFAQKLDVGSWELEIAQLLRQVSIWQYSIGIGGIGKLESRDYGIIGNQLRGEYSYLRAFSNDIISGELSEAQIRARLNLYFNKTRALYERGRREGHRNNGYIWEKRSLNSQQECADCSAYSRMGWQIIGTLPGIGESCSCKSNCRPA
jgi:hypothetical protein